MLSWFRQGLGRALTDLGQILLPQINNFRDAGGEIGTSEEGRFRQAASLDQQIRAVFDLSREEVGDEGHVGLPPIGGHLC